MPAQTCPSCAHQLPERSRECPSCGLPLESPLHEATTRVSSLGVTLPPAVPHGPAGRDPHGPPRFVAGTFLAGRYRVVAPLGRGGVGEVYRAEDLKLGQTVALKFLPERIADDPRALAILLTEVRLARQVSHPDVCRVYDMGEEGGLHFISMEYIDGEDLASLLRRIGRLPEDRALRFARHICAGLAAAHERGIVHRDLKPANVMIDGRGNVRLTDFGLAGLLGAATGESGPRVGTPAYMAPEQHARGETSIRSDIFSLGLILYEMFTGRPGVDPSHPWFVDRPHERGAPQPPRSLVPGLDPVIERVILRCLEKNPAARPATALEVAAGLPGGDPLAAALAAGETPSPEIVASAGSIGTLGLTRAWICLILILAGVAGAASLWPRTSLIGRIPFDKSPAVLVERSHGILSLVDHPGPPIDTAYGFQTDREYLDYLESTDPTPGRWDVLRDGSPPAVYFWYRQSPRHMRALEIRGRVTLSDPPPFAPGMASVRLDPLGRLIELSIVPPQVIGPGEPARPGWERLFHEAGLDIGDFSATAPEWVAPVGSDATFAWQGARPGSPGPSLRVEGAALRGKPVWFLVGGPWTRRPILDAYEPDATDRVSNALYMAMHMGIVVGCLLLVRRHLRSGRSDREGATRAAIFLFGDLTVLWLMEASHTPSVGDEWIMLMGGIGMALFVATLFWLLYMAFEPDLRSRWPHAIISWSRVLTGRLRDPMVGRDLLIGGIFGTLQVLLKQVHQLAPTAMGLPAGRPLLGWHEALLGGGDWVGSFCELLSKAFFAPVAYLCLIMIVWMAVRVRWVAIVLCFLLMTAIQGMGGGHLALDLLFGALFTAIMFVVLLRFGLVALMSMFFFHHMLTVYPLTTDPGAWYAGSTLFAVTICLVTVIAAFLTSLGGKSAFKPPA